MRLKWKIGISIFAVVVFATVVNLCVLGWFFLPSFTELDRHEATANGARAYQYFQDEADHLQTLTRGWARRGDTYQFAGDFNRLLPRRQSVAGESDLPLHGGIRGRRQ